MKAIAFISSLVLAGCFYIDPINQRPSLQIKQQTDDAVFRGDKDLVLEAEVDDPEDNTVTYRWRVLACSDATDESTCDEQTVDTSIDKQIKFDVPAYRSDPDGAGPLPAPPVQSLLVQLDGEDDLGAVAKPRAELVIAVLDREPVVLVSDNPIYGGVTNTPIDVFAVYGDEDDTADNVAIEWKAFSPEQVEIQLTDIAVPQPEDPAYRQVGKRLVPTVTGNWTIRVIATDPLGKTVTVDHTVGVVDDRPLCLGSWSPIAPTGTTKLPLAEPTLFQVPVVTDDLDRYPTVPGDVVLGETTFVWSLKNGAAPRETLVGATGNSVAVDPASYPPGTVLELRVEVFDRRAIAIPCADDVQECSVISDPSCIQRETWRMEVR
ncbi:MAG TPA: hypothetical protein VFQ53_35880 [Kofleriaceae bacterium]|nr:hypothetical protein [Kofleriaceae bacterium]